MLAKINLGGKLLITGHTGFKGTWLSLLAEELGLEIAGISLPPTSESLYSRLNRKGAIEEYFVDINDYESLQKSISEIKPTAVLHLAAQALVEESYKNPIQTFRTNVIGTANLLDICVASSSTNFVGVATTDKVYKNSNSGINFVEGDALSGKDPYSASKVGTESVVAAWQQISSLSSGLSISAFRAGNVIGGGDMADNRIVPDLVKSRIKKHPAIIRNPNSTRPWQHVLDPLMGYLTALQKMEIEKVSAPALNFGPSGDSLEVSKLVEIALDTDRAIPQPKVVEDSTDQKESKFLNLDSSFARESLSWSNKWTQIEAIQSTFSWWKLVLDGNLSALEACKQDIAKLLES